MLPCRGVLGGGRAAQEDWAIAGLRTHLESANLLLTCLGQPRDEKSGGIGLDELLSDPEPLGGCLGLNPDQLPLAEAGKPESR